MPNPPKLDPNRGTRGRGIVILPAEGRTGPPPAWPLPLGMTVAEAAAWADAWRTPQAVMWERLGWTRTVARYVRRLVESEEPGSSPPLNAIVTALEDRLGLTDKAMRLLLWQIGADEVGERRVDSSAARKRIRAV